MGLDRERSESLTPPLGLHEEKLGPDIHPVLSQCSAAVSDHLAGLNNAGLTYLAGATANPLWQIDPDLAEDRARLLGDRDAALRAGLAAALQWGETRDGSAREVSEQMWARLGALDDEIAKLPEIGNPDKLLGAEASRDAAVGYACQERLRDLSVEPAGRARAQTEPIDAGRDDGFGY